MKLDGVEEVTASHADGAVTVRFDSRPNQCHNQRVIRQPD